MLNSSRNYQKKVKSIKEKSNIVSNNINKTNNSNNFTNNTLNNYLNEPLSPCNFNENIIQPQIETNNILNKKIPYNNINIKENKFAKQKTGIAVTDCIDINKNKSKSKIKKSSKRYDNLVESEKNSNDIYLKDLIEADLKSEKAETNHFYLGVADKKNFNNNKNTNKNSNYIQNEIFNVNFTSNEIATIKKFPRDSKSPTIRNYRTKININSISLNENGDGIHSPNNLIEDVVSDVPENKNFLMSKILNLI